MKTAVEEAGENAKRANVSRSEILIVTATPNEFRVIAGLISQRTVGTAGQLTFWKGFIATRPVTLVNAGIGARRFIRPTQVSEYGALLVAGLAGGLDPILKTGDVVIYDTCVSLDGTANEMRSLACDAGFVQSMEMGLRASGFTASRETGVTVGSMITKAKEKIALGTRAGAAVVDMESFPLLNWARGADLPAAVLRVVVDEAGLETPDFNAALTADGRIQSWSLTRELIKVPARTVRFVSRLPRAHRTLKRAVASALY